MGFLHPLWLLLGGAIAVPIILHLLQRHQGPRVVFPAVRYLQRAEREHARRIRLRQLLLLLLRISIILATALAAARPFLRGAGVDHEPSAVVIVLDNSMSSGLVVGDRRVLDELKDRALETLQRATPDDRFWLLRAGAPWEAALPGNASTTAERVRATEPSAAAADIVAAVARARGILAQGAENRAKEIEVLSDLQTGNLRGRLAASSTKEAGGTRVVLWAPARQEQANAAVASVMLGGGLAPRAGERSTIVVGVGGTRVDSMAVRLNIENRIVGAAIARAGASVAIPFPPRPASLLSGSVEIDADALRADDKRYFIATIAPPPRVALGRPVPFVSEALDVLASANRITRTANGANVIIAPAGNGADGVPPSSSVVVIAPETPLELTSLNRRLISLGINWQFQQKPASGALRFATASPSDELLRGLTGVRVAQSYQLTQTAPSADSVILRLEDNSPWAVRGTRARGGRFVLLASPLNTIASNLPASPAMIPLMDRATGVWSAEDAPRSEVQPGERVPMPGNADHVIGADGARIPVKGGQIFTDATAPGVYRIATGSRVIGAFVVNGASIESELRYSAGKRVSRALAPLDVKRVDDAESWVKTVFTHRVGKEVWRFLLMVLLVILLVESVVAATGGRHAPATD